MDLNEVEVPENNVLLVAAHSGCVDLNSIGNILSKLPAGSRSPLGLRGFKFASA